MSEDFLKQRKAWIYKITVGKKVYIGSTISPEKRKKDHLMGLLRNKHHNCKLQRAYNKIKEFLWEIIEECYEIERWKRESHWIAEHNSILNGYNIASVDTSKEAIEDESLIRLVSNNTRFMLLYEKVKKLLIQYSDVSLPSQSPRTVHGIFLSLKVRKDAKKEIKIEHWIGAINKIEMVLEKWQQLPEGHYKWHDHFYQEQSGWNSIQSNARHNFTNRPYEFLEVLLGNAEDPLFKIIVKKLHTDGLLRLRGYEKYHQPFYGPTLPER